MSDVAVAHPGATPLAYEMCAQLRARGYDTHLWTGIYVSDAELALAKSLNPKLHRLLKRRNRPELGVRISRSPLGEILYQMAVRGSGESPLSRTAITLRNEAFQRFVQSKVKRVRPRALLGFDTSSAELIRRKGSSDTKIILNQVIGHAVFWKEKHAELLDLFPAFASSLPQPKTGRAMEAAIEEALGADAVMVPSAHVANTMRRAGTAAEKIHLVPYGVDISRFAPPEARSHKASSRLNLLFVGQASLRKGVPLILEAMRPFGDRVHLTIVGSIVGDVKAYDQYSHMFTHVRNVPHQEVHKHFRTSDLFVYPSFNEGSPLAVFEALASGLPVITTSESGTLVEHGESGVICPATVHGVTNAIAHFLDQPEEIERMALNARTLAERHSWDAFGQNLHVALQQILAK